MNNKIVSGLLALGALFALLATSGCGSSSSSSNDTAPSSMTLYYGHSAVFRNHSSLTSGYNGFGQLGSGNLDQREEFRPVNTLGHVDGVSVGADHTLAFQNNGALYAWGSNQTAQLGNGVSGAGEHSSNPVQVKLSTGTALDGVISAAAGFYHSVAVAEGGNKVYAWGNNTWGQLGNGSFTVSTFPTEVPTLDAAVTGKKVLKVAAGNQFTLAIVDDGSGTKGTVYAWGDNSYGQLGVAKADTTDGRRAVPAEIDPTALHDVVDVVAGVNFCLARTADNKVYAWGDNSVGQLGVDPATVSSRPRPEEVTALTARGAVAKIAAGAFHGLALTSDHQVLAWGIDFFGELGDNNKDAHTVTVGSTTTSASYTPVNVVIADGTQLTNVVNIFAYGDSSFAEQNVDNGGTITRTLYAWGDNRRGQLGLPISTSEVGYLLLATPVTYFFK